MTLIKKKYSTKYFDKGTDELSYMKQAVVTILKKVLYQFEGQSKRPKVFFKLDSGFLKTTFSTIFQNSIRSFF